MKKDPYHRAAKFYDRLFQSVNAGLVAIGMKMFPPIPGMSVLDVGCGTGTLLSNHGLIIEQQKIVSGGNMGIFVLRKGSFT